MKKIKFNLIWSYLKEDKVKVIIYLILFLFAYIPPFLTPVFSGYMIQGLIKNDLNSFLLNLSLFTGINITSYTILRYPLEHIYNYLEIKFMHNISSDLYHKVINLPCLAFEEIGVGEFVNRIYNDIDRIMLLLKKLLKTICKSFVILIFLVISFKINLIIGLEIITFASLMGVMSCYFYKVIRKKNELIKKESDTYIKNITESLYGIREIKALGIKKIIEKNIGLSNNNLFKESSEARKKEISYYTLNGLLYLIMEFIILLTTGILVIRKQILIASFIIIESYIFKIDEVVEGLSDFLVNYNKVIVSLNRLDEILNDKLYKQETFGNKVLNNFQGSLEFKKVSFRYRKEENYILKDLNLKFLPNKSYAIVGKSGNGKSTIFNLLLHYFDTYKGKILIDGIDIHEIEEESLRKCISIVRQKPFLFNKTIFANFSLLNDKITLKEVRKYCKMAYIDDYIMSLPKKYNTIIGEGGVNLSGGQLQRIAIARTLVLNTKIILFDEATSSLDSESQEYIKKVLTNLAHDHTVIIIAHRTSTIKNCDKIYVIDSKKCVDEGSHEELIKTSSIYRKLYKEYE